ncbi:hypothetical protein ACHAWF_000760 [Thalassiosira exigua]
MNVTDRANLTMWSKRKRALRSTLGPVLPYPLMPGRKRETVVDPFAP